MAPKQTETPADEDAVDPNIELRAALIAAAADKKLEEVAAERGVNVAEIIEADAGELAGLGLLFLAAAILQNDSAGIDYLLGDGDAKPGVIADVAARLVVAPAADGEPETQGKWRYAAGLIVAYRVGNLTTAELLIQRGIPLQLQWSKSCIPVEGLPEGMHHKLLTGDTPLTAACRSASQQSVRHALSSMNKSVLAHIWTQFLETAEPLLVAADGAAGAPMPAEGSVIALLFGSESSLTDDQITELGRVYSTLKEAEKPFEIIFVSNDHEQEVFERIRQQLPGLAIGFEHAEKRTEISNLFGACPDKCTLHVFDYSGTVSAVDALSAISADEDASRYPWQQPEVGLHVWPTPAEVPSTAALVNTSSKQNERAIHIALQSSDFDGLSQIVEDLLKAGADVQLMDDTGATAAVTAALHGHFDSLQNVLQAAGSKPDLDAVLRAACSGHHLSCAQHLVSEGANIHSQDKVQQRNCLMLACIGEQNSGCNIKLVEFLLAQQADVHVCDKKGLAPLHHACSDHNPKQEFEVVQMLIGAGADTYLADNKGRTAWDYALADSGVYEVLAQPISIDMCFVLGAPGSGKSSQAKLLANAFNFKVYTVESCLLEASKIRPGIKVQLLELQAQNKGQIPAALVATALRSCLEILQRNTSIDDGQEKYKICLDGFPSTIQEARELERVVGQPHYVFALDVSYQDSMRRLCLDSRGKRLSEEAVKQAGTMFNDFKLGFESIVELYESAGKLRRYCSSDKDGVMSVFNQIKPQYGYLEASAIISRMNNQCQAVTQGRLAGKDKVADAQQTIQNFRTAAATEIRNASHENTLILERTRFEKFGI